MLQTTSLQLLPITRIHIAALLRSKTELATLLQVAIPDSWPTFPEAFSLPPDEPDPKEPSPTRWGGYFFLHRQDKILVGNGGFKGTPDAAGTIEIGYEIASEQWNRGFGTEATRGMIDYAFAHPEVPAFTQGE